MKAAKLSTVYIQGFVKHIIFCVRHALHVEVKFLKFFLAVFSLNNKSILISVFTSKQPWHSGSLPLTVPFTVKLINRFYSHK